MLETPARAIRSVRYPWTVFIDAIRRSVSAWNHPDARDLDIALFYVHLSQAFDDDVGTVLTQGLTLLAVIDTDYASKAASFAGFDPGQSILE